MQHETRQFGFRKFSGRMRRYLDRSTSTIGSSSTKAFKPSIASLPERISPSDPDPIESMENYGRHMAKSYIL